MLQLGFLKFSPPCGRIYRSLELSILTPPPASGIPTECRGVNPPPGAHNPLALPTVPLLHPPHFIPQGGTAWKCGGQNTCNRTCCFEATVSGISINNRDRLITTTDLVTWRSRNSLLRLEARGCQDDTRPFFFWRWFLLPEGLLRGS